MHLGCPHLRVLAACGRSSGNKADVWLVGWYDELVSVARISTVCSSLGVIFALTNSFRSVVWRSATNLGEGNRSLNGSKFDNITCFKR